MRRTLVSSAMAAIAVLSFAGCSEPAPTGAVLFADAKQHYFDYRAVTNDVQALIFDGPWHAEPSSYGMQPSGAGCGDNGYKFDLTRTTSVDPAAQPALSAAVAAHLSEAGYSVEGQDLGSALRSRRT
ncbi:hypothetical protein [Pseudoclavibacter helvolus]|uniref:hypothetical protein n=1 Tax=Pseudoclavibacter helvolus TaxID=255205 RepID=UPI003C73C73A